MKYIKYDIKSLELPKNLNQNLLIFGDLHGNIKKLF